ncbi:MAG: class I poly(R)-hydroxyalkanoic acid synthase [Pseudomonadota bacterium]
MAREETTKPAAKSDASAGGQTAGPLDPMAMLSGASPLEPSEVAALAGNMAQVFEKSQLFWAQLANAQLDGKRPMHFDPYNAAGSFQGLWESILENPEELASKTTQFWTDQAEIWRRSMLKAAGQEVEPVVEPAKGDKRFKDDEWSQNAVFDALKQSYLLASGYLADAAHEMGDIEDRDRRKVEFFTRQFVEALSPTNFFAMNPEALRVTYEEKGANLVRGLNNMMTDLERGKGQLQIRQTDLEKFKVGENMAITPGKVIYRNDLIELIQYTPSTETVQQRPVLICPPWINKYYILDLNPKKSMVKWLVDQGHTVFMISWVNPDERHGEKMFADYVAEGLFEAIVKVLEETGSEDLHLAAYCIGGTMTMAALAYLAGKPDHPLADRVASCTFFTSQAEFSNAGELQLFVDDEQLEMLEDEMIGGTLGADKMASAFNMLRSSDLIWGFVINNYMLGREPFPFDLLYWNSDSTRMPARVHTYYLKRFYRDDALASGELRLGGVPLDLGQISIPTYHVATKEDHIAPPDSVYRGVRLLGGDRRFVLAGSGHIAGVVNPPESGKYQHWVRDDGAFPGTVEHWRQSAVEHPGSWWTDWDAWMKELNGGEEVEARQPGRRFNAIADAPGAYVQVRYDAPKMSASADAD